MYNYIQYTLTINTNAHPHTPLTPSHTCTSHTPHSHPHTTRRIVSEEERKEELIQESSRQTRQIQQLQAGLQVQYVALATYQPKANNVCLTVAKTTIILYSAKISRCLMFRCFQGLAIVPRTLLTVDTTCIDIPYSAKLFQ